GIKGSSGNHSPAGGRARAQDRCPLHLETGRSNPAGDSRFGRAGAEFRGPLGRPRGADATRSRRAADIHHDLAAANPAGDRHATGRHAIPRGLRAERAVPDQRAGDRRTSAEGHHPPVRRDPIGSREVRRRTPLQSNPISPEQHSRAWRITGAHRKVYCAPMRNPGRGRTHMDRDVHSSTRIAPRWAVAVALLVSAVLASPAAQWTVSAAAGQTATLAILHFSVIKGTTWSGAHHRAAQRIAQKYPNVKYVYREEVGPDVTIPYAEELIRQNANIVVGNAEFMGLPLKEIADKYPKVY